MESQRKRKAKNGKVYWEAEVAGFLSSGLRQREYCQQRGLNYYTFRHWYYQLQRTSPKAQKGKSPRFCEVLPVASYSGSSCRIILGRGLVLELSELAPVAFLAELARAMG